MAMGGTGRLERVRGVGGGWEVPRWMNGIGRGLGWFGKVAVGSVDQSGASCVDLRGLGFGAMRCDVCLEFGGGGSERKRKRGGGDGGWEA